MSQSEKPFNVSDRRHFTPEGRPRDESEGRAEPEAEPKPAAREDASAPEPPVEFSHFVLGLASEAGRFITGEGLPVEMPADERLRSARHVIAILEMLKDKTEGRRTADEDALLGELLFQLRMAYVERSRAGKP
jgi:hypothetical protein